jgi:hypothetical protein
VSPQVADFTIRVDDSDVLGYLEKHSRHAPHALAHALNRTAEEALDAIWTHVKSVMTIRTLPRQFVAPKILPTALRARNDKLFAVIETEGIGKLLNPFETGIPHFGGFRPVAVPSAFLRTTKATVIPRRLYPGNLGLAPMRDAGGALYYARGKGSKQRGLSGPKPTQGRYNTFQIGNVIYQRTGPGQAGIKPIWFLKPSVPRPANLEYLSTAQRIVQERWAINLRGEWEYEMRRAGIV